MKSNYSWETEDEGDWELVQSPEPTPPRKGSRTLLMLVAGVAVACLLILLLLDRRLEGREAIIQQNVIAAHRTWKQAVESQDLELFSSLISREHTDWYQAQRKLLMSGRLFGRDSFGLDLMPDAPALFVVDLDSGWRRAVLTFPQEYEIENSDGGRSISLFQTQTYQITGNRWLLAQPPDSLWGAWVTKDIGLINVSYPERDSEIISRLTSDLARDIAEICAQFPTARECAPESRISLHFVTDPESLLILGDQNTPALSGRTIKLPTPSLVGLPVDDDAYDALYAGYTERIQLMLRNNLALPIPFPEQNVVALCFPTLDQGLTLYAYHPATGEWSEQSQARRFSFAQALPDDSAIILRAGFPGVEIAHLELVLQRQGREIPLYKEGTTEQSARFDGIPIRPQSNSLLLSTIQGSTGIINYRLLPLESCGDGACDVNSLAGFPLWSPSGDKTLILVGSQLFIGDNEGTPILLVGRAFSPFWLTDNTFGYIRLLGGSTNESPDMELVVRSVETGEERLLAKSADLLRQFDSDDKGAFRIMFITSSPKDPNLLFLAGTPVSRGGGQFLVLKIQLNGSPDSIPLEMSISTIEVILNLDDVPVGDPTTLTPTGYPPFMVTPDGRRLMVVRFADPVTNTWVIYLYNIEDRETKVITLNYPIYPAPFPFYDWSADGNWLLLVDNGFFRLLAPDYDYERSVTHDFAACRYPAWVNRSAVEVEAP